MLASDIPIPEKVSRARLCEEDSESSEDNDTQEEEVVGHKSSVSSSASTLLDDDIEEVVSSAFNPPLDPRRYKGRALFSAGSSSGKSGPETECQSETVFRPLRRRPLSSSHVQDDMSQNSESASQAMIVQIPPTGILELPNSHENIQVKSKLVRECWGRLISRHLSVRSRLNEASDASASEAGMKVQKIVSQWDPPHFASWGAFLVYTGGPGNMRDDSKNSSMIHVLNRDTKQSLHLSGFSAILSDLAFAADHSRVILATIDVEGRLQVLEIKESEDQFRTLLSTKLLSTQIRWESSDPGESKYALTWKPIVPGSDNEFRYQIGISANSCHLCVLGLRDGYPDSPPAPLYPLGGKRGCVAFEPSVVGFKLSGRHQMICVADKTGVILLNYNSRDDGVPKEIEIDPRSIGCEVSGSWLIDYAGESDEKPSLNQLLLLGLNGNSQFELWDFQANVCLQSLSLSSSREEPLKPEFAVAIDPNGKFIAVGRKTYGKRTQLFLMILKWPEKDLPKVTTVCEYNVPVSLLSLQVSSKLDDPDDLCTLMVGGTFGIYGLIIPLKDPCKSVKKGFAPIRKRAENLAHIIYARETNCSLELERTPKEIVHLESLEESFFLSRKGKKEETNDSPVKEEILSPLKDEKEICLRDSTTSDAMCAPVQARPATPGVGLSNRRVFSRDLPPRKLLSSFEGSEVIFEEPEEEEKEEEGSSANVPKESLDPQARTPGGAYAINSLPDGLRSHGDSSDSGQCSAFEKEEEEDSKNDLKRFVVNGFKALDTKFERLESCITENYDCLNDRLLKLEEKMECGFAKRLEEMRDKLCDDFSLKIEPDLNSSADSDEHEKDTSDGVILESASRKKVLGYIAKQKFDKALALASAENDPSWPLVVCLRVRLPKIVDSLKTETLLKLLKCLTNNFGTMISPRMVCIEAIVLKINWTDNPHTRYLLCRLHAAINEYSLKGEESDTCRERMSRLSSIVKKQLREQEEDD